jgi:glutathione S-transferase
MRCLYHLPLSPACRKVRLALAEKRLPFELQVEPVWEQREEYLALNPAGTVPTLIEGDGFVVPDSSVICEYLEETYPEICLLGFGALERVEARRLVVWFDGKFAREVTDHLAGQKYLRRIAGRGGPESASLRLGYANLKPHLEHLGWLAENRNWLAGAHLTLADLAAAAHISVLDFFGDIDWSKHEAVRDWYARIKHRPSFRPLLEDRVPGMFPPAHYANLDF